MATTSKDNPKTAQFAMVDWFQAHGEALKRLRPKDKEEKSEAQNFMKFLWPASQEYYSPLNPIFLAENFSAQILNERSIWLARDGLVPLLWFFKKNPRPEKFRQRLLVHEDFAPFVPTPWRPQVGTYRVHHVARPQEQGKERKLFLTGLISETVCSLDHVDELLQKTVTTLGAERVRNLDKICFFVDKLHGYGGEGKHELFCEYMFRTCRALGAERIKAINWVTLDAMASFEGYDILDLNEKLLYADSFLVHLFLQKGGRLLDFDEPKVSKEKGRFIRLSPHHGMVIQEKVTGSYALENHLQALKGAESYLSKFETVMRSKANLGMPWPSWILSWGKIAAAKSKRP